MILTEHDRNKFKRMAEDCYAKGANDTGLRYMVAATTPDWYDIGDVYFARLQSDYCRWLMFGKLPTVQA